MSWRLLYWFWAALLAIVITGATLLQILGPPLKPSAPIAAVPLASGQALPTLTAAEQAGALAAPTESTSEGKTGLGNSPSPPELQRVNDLMTELLERAQAGAPEERSDPPLNSALLLQGKVSLAPRVEPRRHNGPELSIYYSAGSRLSDSKVRELALRLGSRFPDIRMHAQAEAPQIATVRFYFSEDHATARDLGMVLADMGYAWQIENLSNQVPAPQRRTIEVWIQLR